METTNQNTKGIKGKTLLSIPPPQNRCKKKGWREGRKGGGGEEWHLLPFKGTQLHDQAVYLEAQRKAESEYDIEEKSTQAT